MDGLGEGVGGCAVAEEFNAFFWVVDAAGLGEFADCDRAGWVDAALVDPVLDAV